MEEKKRLSSSLTLTYKYIAPIFPVAQAGLVNTVARRAAASSIFMNPVNYFFAGVFLLLFFSFRGLKKVEYDKHKLIVSNYLSSSEFDLKEVIEIKRRLFYFYIIHIEIENEIKRIKFMPSISERIRSPFKKLDSIYAFEKAIQTIK